MKAAKREAWMPDLSDLRYGDPKMEKLRGSHKGELNSNYRHGGYLEENKKAYLKEYYRKYYLENKDKY